MDIVDSQVHLNRTGANWRDTDPEQTLAAGILAMDAVGVDAAIMDERWGAHILQDDRHMLRLANGVIRYSFPFSELGVSRHPKRLAYVGRVERDDPDLSNLMADMRRRPGCVAMRIEPTPQVEEIEPFRNGAYDAYFEAARKCGMPVFVRMTREAELVEPYLRKFPDVQFILDHCGTVNPPPPTWDERMANIDKVAAMAKFPNLALKWCKAPSRISMQPYPYRDVMPVLRKLMDAFGPWRLMWAGDATQTTAQHSWAEALYYLIHADVIDASEKEWLLGKAARSILNWPAA